MGTDEASDVRSPSPHIGPRIGVAETVGGLLAFTGLAGDLLSLGTAGLRATLTSLGVALVIFGFVGTYRRGREQGQSAVHAVVDALFIFGGLSFFASLVLAALADARGSSSSGFDFPIIAFGLVYFSSAVYTKCLEKPAEPKS